jgi:salicylate hydroxylase
MAESRLRHIVTRPQRLPQLRPDLAGLPAGLPMLIAGGGIGGLAAALAIAETGLRVQVLERRDTAHEAGAGIQIGPNGTSILQMLGVAPRLVPLVGQPSSIIARDGRTGAALAELPLGRWIEERHGAPYWTALRQDLHGALLDAALAHPRISVVRGFEIDDITEAPERVEATSTDGRAHVGRGLIGADGVWSTIRRKTFSVEDPKFTGRSAVRALLPIDKAPSALRGASTGLWLSPGSHLVHYPVRSGRDIAIVLIVGDDTREDGWSRDVLPGWIAAHTHGLAPLAADLLNGVRGWQRWSLVAAPPLRRWSAGRVTLLGDAAHPMLPFLAQGAVMALEDAVVLARSLAATRGDAPQAFEAYERQRSARTRRVVAAAARNGQIYHLSGLAAEARNFTMRSLGGPRLMSSYDWLYRWRGP